MAARMLAKQFKELTKDPTEGVIVELANGESLFEWRIWLEGPPDTVFSSGIFQLKMKFPPEFPMQPPKLYFVSNFWHPNVFKDGKVCISILHPPGEDVMSGELASERWLPTQSVSSIIMSVVSMLAAPNFSSPANVDASVEWRNRPDLYEQRMKKLIAKANSEVPPYIVIPHPESNQKEREKRVERMHTIDKPLDDTEVMYDVDAAEISDEDYNNEDDDDDNNEVDSSEIEKPMSKSEGKQSAVFPVQSVTQANGTPKEEKGEKGEKGEKKKSKCVVM